MKLPAILLGLAAVVAMAAAAPSADLEKRVCPIVCGAPCYLGAGCSCIDPVGDGCVRDSLL